MALRRPERCWGGRQGVAGLLCPQPALSLYPITPALALINGATVQTHTHTETGPRPVITWLKGLEDIAFLPFTLPKKKKLLKTKTTTSSLCHPPTLPLLFFSLHVNRDWLEREDPKWCEVGSTFLFLLPSPAVQREESLISTCCCFPSTLVHRAPAALTSH